ncbi:NAD(P)/FAD-dependent oxidoreductase [Solwaraspora sp. WMMD937]|uniref:bifunctional NAD(P)/FAD-dependent oxidoreductase/class I SAM-dependent methyltransferase n=1 Tax=unclassified Solwaraspora TaxID=2627926 RepID=UPI00248B20DE|nr:MULTISPECIES: bifunctional NAD(P)/FAD-dependent oxidoreductase/class I SAM-dependent methyltransferase [unclassified Solwaraspora]WBB95716.1 NAD(P)/FAD-dependent oxidoreductase [Solwaraspora sp. WMMA2059]WBC20380.1 NAD(P)/FAD-dependent oxidoreductase [Solwaraspora sp. WMMA2080]WFE21684.1 NAD(P)/FAD-dependent oxidoreductase [Solwaraspora sp. WMMD937]
MADDKVGGPTYRVAVAVIGGGAAGLSAALTLARARRAVIVIDAGEPRNTPSAGVHGYLSRDGISPAGLVAAGRQEVERYGGVVLPGRAEAVERVDSGFEISLADGRTVAARRLLFATGVVDELPDIPGLRDRWGRDVLHCPYCHGWEVRDQPVGVLATGEMALHQVQLFRQWTSDLVLFTHTGVDLTDEQAEQLAARGVRVVPGEVVGLEAADDRLTGVRLADGTMVPRAAVTVASRLRVDDRLLTKLGVPLTRHPSGMAEQVEADPTGRTPVPGVWAAGNLTNPFGQVMAAAAAGAMAAAAVNGDLAEEDTADAVRRHRAAVAGADDSDLPVHHGPADVAEIVSPTFWDERYGSVDRVWSGNPNPQLVAVATELPAGTACDVGAGEGADAIWLAGRGWKVTAVDVSAVALRRAAEQAAASDDDVAKRLTWQPADIRTWDPGPDRFDLVTAQFMHLPDPDRAMLHRRLAAAVRPGGTLLIVGHHPSDLDVPGLRRPRMRDLLFTAEQVAAVLDPRQWASIRAETVPRPGTDPDGNPVTVHDAVLHAVRRR